MRLLVNLDQREDHERGAQWKLAQAPDLVYIVRARVDFRWFVRNG